MNDWISWSASMHFCSISIVQLRQPPMDLGVHMDTQTHSFTNGGGYPSIRLSREGHRLIGDRGVLHRGWTGTEMSVFPSHLLILIVGE